MKSAYLFALMVCLAGTAPALAEEPVRAQTWSLGGAALANSESGETALWTASGLSAGVESANPSLGKAALGSSGLQAGGFLAWQSSIYRISATLSPSYDGQVAAGLGASMGAPEGEEGTRYGLRIGTAWAPSEHFTINAASGLSLSELAAPNNNVNVSLLVNHALTPNLNLIGLAEAQRGFGLSPLDGGSGLGRLMVGAGLGYKF
jgi:hypothetical protein